MSWMKFLQFHQLDFSKVENLVPQSAQIEEQTVQAGQSFDYPLDELSVYCPKFKSLLEKCEDRRWDF